MSIEAQMLEKGRQRLTDLIEESGGCYTPEYVAERMRITVDAVRKMAANRTMLCVFDDPEQLPVFQFDFPIGGLAFGLGPMLKHECLEGWSHHEIILFLLVRHDPEHSDLVPITLMRQGNGAKAYKLLRVHYTQRP